MAWAAEAVEKQLAHTPTKISRDAIIRTLIINGGNFDELSPRPIRSGILSRAACRRGGGLEGRRVVDFYLRNITDTT